MKKLITYDYKIYKSGYNKRLEISSVISLIFLIFIFYFFPKFVSRAFMLPEIPHPEIIVIDIPQTIQPNVKRPPRPSRPVIPIPSEDMSILEDITIEIEDIEDLIAPDKVFNPDELEGLPYMPRQVLEVLPEKTADNPKGEVLLSLHVDKNGNVKAHKVIKNTTESRHCLESVIKAAYSSRWQPVIIDENIYEYWIYKSYQFDK
jgi:hypothetical protein